MNVSVVIPAYNAAATLADTLDSLLRQTLTTWEAIVVDDGSTDATAELAAAYAARDSRVRVITQSNGGESAARNTGVRQAREPWLLFLDADDWIAPAHLARMTAALAADPTLDAVLCRSVRVALDGTHISDDYDPPVGDLFPTLAKRAAFPVHACLVRRTLVEAVGLFDTTLRKSPDWDLWQRIARTGARFGAVRDVLAFYRMQPASASLEAEQLLRDGLRVLRQGHAADPRVQAPAPEHAQGEPPDGIDSQQYYLLCWCAGLLVGQDRSPLPLFELIPATPPTTLYANAVARTLFEATTLPRCLPRSAWESLWPTARPLLDGFLPVLERRTATPRLAADTLRELALAIARHSPLVGEAVRSAETQASADAAALRAWAEDAEARLARVHEERARWQQDYDALRQERDALQQALWTRAGQRLGLVPKPASRTSGAHDE